MLKSKMGEKRSCQGRWTFCRQDDFNMLEEVVHLQTEPKQKAIEL